MPAEWHGRMRPKPGTIVNVAVLPQNARTALLIGGTLVLAVGAAFVGPLVAGAIDGPLGTIAGAVAAGGIQSPEPSR